MVLIFAETQAQITNEMNLSPKENFRRVISVSSVRGQTFTGVIMMYGWWKNRLMLDAKEALEYRQPELFKDI